MLASPAATGDIDDMWLRDSSVQLAIYLPRVRSHPALRGVFEGMLRTQAFYILQVPSVEGQAGHLSRESRFPTTSACMRVHDCDCT